MSTPAPSATDTPPASPAPDTGTPPTTPTPPEPNLPPSPPVDVPVTPPTSPEPDLSPPPDPPTPAPVPPTPPTPVPSPSPPPPAPVSSPPVPSPSPPPPAPVPSPPVPSPSPPPPAPVPSPPVPSPSPPPPAPVPSPPVPSPSPPPPDIAPVTPPPSPSPPTPSPSPTPPAPTPQTPPSPSPPPLSPPSPTPSPPPPILSPPSSQPTPQSPPLSPPVVSDSPPPPTLNPTRSPPTSVEIPPPPGSSNRTSTGLIVGVAMGGVAVLAIFGLLWLLFARRKKKKDPYGTEGYYLPRDGFYQGSAQSGTQSNPQSAEHHSMSKSPTALAAVPSRSNSSTPQQLSTSASGGLWSNSSGPDNSVPPSSHGLVLGNVSSNFTFEELSVATDGFSNNNLLGQGGFGYVHKGILPNGKIVAIKSLKAESGQGEREFQAEVETISRVHHKHLVTLVGYCVTGQHKLLVYEFLPNKTMEFHLHGKGQPVMDWATRLKIAVGAAKGLAYLHEDCHPTIIHRDIKAANILLDFNFEAQVADFGLAKFTSDANTHVSTRVMGTFGYLAPEYANSGKLTEKSDVFSFGVMLLEFITGRRPVDYSPESQMDDSLVDWARPLLSKAVQDGDFDPLVDPRLENRFNYEELGCMITCAASCVRHSAKRRPRMSQVVRALEGNLSLSDLNDGVRPGFSSIHSSSDFDSSTDREETRKFKKLEYLSEDFSRTRSEFSDSGLSSSEMRRRT